jgi:transposase-like protein
VVSAYLERLAHCADVTRDYCSRFSGILLVDGKYAKVKGYRKEIPVIYGIDYQTHDIPNYALVRGESLVACRKFFGSLKLTGYPLTAVVADDNSNLREAARYCYPNTTVQLCLNHYQQAVKYTLNLEANQQHQAFYRSFKTLFAFKRSVDDFNRVAKNILTAYRNDPICVSLMTECYRKLPLLTGWRQGKHIPTTTNLIESFNSHLEGRLKTIKGFENFHHANLWFNGYFLYRRLKPFTDCHGKFRRLNGKTSLSQTKKPGIEIPSFFS